MPKHSLTPLPERTRGCRGIRQDVRRARAEPRVRQGARAAGRGGQEGALLHRVESFSPPHALHRRSRALRRRWLRRAGVAGDAGRPARPLGCLRLQLPVSCADAPATALPTPPHLLSKRLSRGRVTAQVDHAAVYATGVYEKRVRPLPRSHRLARTTRSRPSPSPSAVIPPAGAARSVARAGVRHQAARRGCEARPACVFRQGPRHVLRHRAARRRGAAEGGVRPALLGQSTQRLSSTKPVILTHALVRRSVDASNSALQALTSAVEHGKTLASEQGAKGVEAVTAAWEAFAAQPTVKATLDKLYPAIQSSVAVRNCFAPTFLFVVRSLVFSRAVNRSTPRRRPRRRRTTRPHRRRRRPCSRRRRVLKPEPVSTYSEVLLLTFFFAFSLLSADHRLRRGGRRSLPSRGWRRASTACARSCPRSEPQEWGGFQNWGLHNSLALVRRCAVQWRSAQAISRGLCLCDHRSLSENRCNEEHGTAHAAVQSFVCLERVLSRRPPKTH